MKILLLTLLMLLTTKLFSQYLPDTTASRLKIIKVVRNMKATNNQTVFTDYYDKTGKVVKSESLDKYSDEKTITTNKYENGLLINETFKSYYKNKRSGSQSTTYGYDTNKKIISTTTYLDDKRIFKDTIVYSKYTDTTYSYSNDTMIYDVKRKLKLVAPVNTFHNEKTTVNYYDEMGNKLKQIIYSYRDRERCMNINRFSMTDSTGYTIMDFVKSMDTTIEKVTTWLCVSGKETKVNKSLRISRKKTYKEQWGKVTNINDELNDLGLITSRTIVNMSDENNKDETKITFTYSFDKSK